MLVTPDLPPSERERRSRILGAAETMLAQEGEHGLQMKRLAGRADVALATLYRYFPSKEHVLAAISLDRHLRSLDRMDPNGFAGDTPGERAADLLLREFRACQRNPEFAGALLRVANDPGRSRSAYVEAIIRALEEMLLLAVTRRRGDATAEQQALVPIVLSTNNDAMSQWLRGTLSAEDTRARIRQVCRLFDLPPEIVREYLM